MNDPNYPGPNDSYITFRIDRGLQTLDGATALQYARSRKTTSDSDRSLLGSNRLLLRLSRRL
ncbi:MAG: hypothetical protein H6765_02195 [Candidatus Peribacteria bacterium]|nr:MAG: hypothetical protein H6765_02195 [Candidatus Peribacteria bacterium]